MEADIYLHWGISFTEKTAYLNRIMLSLGFLNDFDHRALPILLLKIVNNVNIVVIDHNLMRLCFQKYKRNYLNFLIHGYAFHLFSLC